MTRTLMAGALFLGTLAMGIPRGGAQDAPAKTSVAAGETKSGGEQETVTGCIQRGDAVSQYKVATKDGAVWDLDSKKIKLSPHVNHTVTISGVVLETFDKAHPRKVVVNDNRKGILSVGKLTMVSTMCEQ
jgi:hypothetical protein